MHIPSQLAVTIDRVAGAIEHTFLQRTSEHPDTRDLLEAYYDLPEERAFPRPQPPDNVYLRRRTLFGNHFVCEDFRFDSAYEPITEEYRRRHLREYARNQLVTGRILRHKDDFPRPYIIYLHGWLQPGAIVEERILFPRMLRQLDVNIVHLNLPFHGRRKPADSLVHGDFFWTSDLVRTFEAVRQSVSDVRQVAGYLRRRFALPVGLLGVSLGGVITMSTVCVDREIDFAVPIIAHQSLTDAVTRAPILARMNEDLRKQGLDADELRMIERRIGLGKLRPVIPSERQLWINARHDQFIHADVVERQWEEWERPPIRWYDGSHLSVIFEIPQIMRWVSQFLDELALVPRHGVRRLHVA